MTIKAKWDKLHLGTSNTYMWVFVKGTMFVICEAAHDQDLKENINKKTFYEGTVIKKEKGSAKK